MEQIYKTESSRRCAEKLRKPPSEFFSLISEKFNDITVTGDYYNLKSKLNAVCNKCGNEWHPTAYALQKSQGCPRCTSKRTQFKNRKSHQQFVDELKEKNPNVKVLSTYETANSRIQCECVVCGNTWAATARNLTTGYGCRKCGFVKGIAAQRKNGADFKSQMSDINENIEILGAYTTSKSKILCRCLICNNTWLPLPCNLLKGEGCPYCRKSHGESAIEKYLKGAGVKYVCNKKYDDLVGVGGGLLSYDFYLPDQSLLIEFQGRQHSEPVRVFGGDDSLNIQNEHDRRKREFAKRNAINLLEIWYYQEDMISDIINNALKGLQNNNPCIDHSG